MSFKGRKKIKFAHKLMGLFPNFRNKLMGLFPSKDGKKILGVLQKGVRIYPN
jgi:hypothetical protein